MMMRVTRESLIGACADQLKTFAAEWPAGVEVSEAALLAVATALRVARGYVVAVEGLLTRPNLATNDVGLCVAALQLAGVKP